MLMVHFRLNLTTNGQWRRGGCYVHVIEFWERARGSVPNITLVPGNGEESCGLGKSRVELNYFNVEGAHVWTEHVVEES
jgi:hypothetical protein